LRAVNEAMKIGVSAARKKDDVRAMVLGSKTIVGHRGWDVRETWDRGLLGDEPHTSGGRCG
jgi:hypothetical protein